MRPTLLLLMMQSIFTQLTEKNRFHETVQFFTFFVCLVEQTFRWTICTLLQYPHADDASWRASNLWYLLHTSIHLRGAIYLGYCPM